MAFALTAFRYNWVRNGDIRGLNYGCPVLSKFVGDGADYNYGDSLARAKALRLLGEACAAAMKQRR